MEVLRDDFSHPKEDQQIVKVLSSRGNNLHEVEAADGSTFLVSMPTKFRKNIWVKRGDFLVAEPIKEGDKVKAEMVKVLTPEHIKCFKKDGIWPSAFGGSDKTEKDDDELFVNTNRVCVIDYGVSSNSESEDDDESDSSANGNDSDSSVSN